MCLVIRLVLIYSVLLVQPIASYLPSNFTVRTYKHYDVIVYQMYINNMHVRNTTFPVYTPAGIADWSLGSVLPICRALLMVELCKFVVYANNH